MWNLLSVVYHFFRFLGFLVCLLKLNIPLKLKFNHENSIERDRKLKHSMVWLTYFISTLVKVHLRWVKQLNLNVLITTFTIILELGQQLVFIHQINFIRCNIELHRFYDFNFIKVYNDDIKSLVCIILVSFYLSFTMNGKCYKWYLLLIKLSNIWKGVSLHDLVSFNISLCIFYKLKGTFFKF